MNDRIVIHLGEQPINFNDADHGTEFFCLVENELGEPIDTFYSPDAGALVSEVTLWLREGWAKLQ